MTVINNLIDVYSPRIEVGVLGSDIQSEKMFNHKKAIDMDEAISKTSE